MRAQRILPEGILATPGEAKCISMQMPYGTILQQGYSTSYVTASHVPSSKNWYFIHEIHALSS